MSEGLKRAREPFRVRNALTGIAIAAFGVGVWAYSISAVRQDVFDDIDEEAKALAAMPGKAPAVPRASGTSGGGASSMVITNGAGLASLHPVMTPAAVVAIAETEKEKAEEVASTQAGAPRGVLAAVLNKTLPTVLDPKRKTLVWGAPPVDRIGRIGETRTGW
jgi:cytochrome c oxidase assembly factor 3